MLMFLPSREWDTCMQGCSVTAQQKLHSCIGVPERARTCAFWCMFQGLLLMGNGGQWSVCLSDLAAET